MVTSAIRMPGPPLPAIVFLLIVTRSIGYVATSGSMSMPAQGPSSGSVMPIRPTPVIVFLSMVTSRPAITEMPFRLAPRIRLSRIVTGPA